jgi:hypothetical protein
MSVKQTGVTAHDAACNAAELTRQVAVAAASTQAAVTAADLAYHRACVASSRANNGSSDIELHLAALRNLGVQT